MPRKAQKSEGSVNDLDLIHIRSYVDSYLDLNWQKNELKKCQSWALDNSPFLQFNNLHRPLGVNLPVAAIWAARSWEAEYKTDPNFHPQGGAQRLFFRIFGGQTQTSTNTVLGLPY